MRISLVRENKDLAPVVKLNRKDTNYIQHGLGHLKSQYRQAAANLRLSAEIDPQGYVGEVEAKQETARQYLEHVKEIEELEKRLKLT